MPNIAGLLILVSSLFSACTSLKSSQKSGEINHLKLLSEYVIPFNYQFNKTTVGGLSGIDFNPEKNEYYFISDDRSNKNPARFYTAQIVITNDKIDTVIFLKSTFLKDKFGNTYPNSAQDPAHTPDPEALRYDRSNHTFIWSSEGERIVTSQKTVLENPVVTIINPQGNFIDTFQLPSQLIMSAQDRGPRQNGVFEGLTFMNDYKSLLVSVETPLLQDGPAAGPGDSSAIIRMIKYNIESRK
ncbi:MAG: esterase-like activity of phytase family protein, partial [Ginsengibacter sp.]